MLLLNVSPISVLFHMVDEPILTLLPATAEGIAKMIDSRHLTPDNMTNMERIS